MIHARCGVLTPLGMNHVCQGMRPLEGIAMSICAHQVRGAQGELYRVACHRKSTSTPGVHLCGCTRRPREAVHTSETLYQDVYLTRGPSAYGCVTVGQLC